MRVFKVDESIFSAPGQTLLEDNDLCYSQVMIRCVKCNEVQEPPINNSAGTLAMQKSYADLITLLNKKS
jgi:hypothetical protein